jgi:hypothetical protein
MSIDHKPPSNRFWISSRPDPASRAAVVTPSNTAGEAYLSALALYGAGHRHIRIGDNETDKSWSIEAFAARYGLLEPVPGSVRDDV